MSRGEFLSSRGEVQARHAVRLPADALRPEHLGDALEQRVCSQRP